MASAFEGCDPVLRRYLTAAGLGAVETALCDLVANHIAPVARASIQSSLRPSRSPWRLGRDRRGADDSDDLFGTVILKVICRLQLLREGGAVLGIANLYAFVRATCEHAVSDHRRAHAPGRTLVAKRVDFHLPRMPDVKVTTEAAGRRLTLVAESSSPPICRVPTTGTHLQASIRDALRDAGGTMLHQDLVKRIACDLGTPEGVTLLSDLAPDNVVDELIADREVGAQPERDALARDEIRLIWRHLLELPAHQRAALLLGLEDIAMFPLSGTASLREIAASLSISCERLSAMWRELPMSDARIAAFMSTTEVRVRNYRKCARERLGRRMAAAGLRCMGQGGRS